MHIGMISPIAWRTPPRHYGPWERVASLLTERLVNSGMNNDDICYVGSADAKVRNRLLGKAFALLHPINFAEPFGLSVVEAFACGTLVIANNRGSMPEIITVYK